MPKTNIKVTGASCSYKDSADCKGHNDDGSITVLLFASGGRRYACDTHLRAVCTETPPDALRRLPWKQAHR